MTGDEVRRIRTSLGLTQEQLASLVGVHGLTVSKWERGLLQANPYQSALISSFEAAASRRPGIGTTVAGLLVGAGIGLALYEILRAAFDTAEE